MARLDDPDRLAALRASGLLDAPAEPALDRLTRIAARATGAPIALISLVDDGRQFFASALGIGEPWASRRQTPLSYSFCKHVVIEEEALEVPDAREHPRVCDNLAVTELGVLAYLGVPLVLDGQILGALCVVDEVPRTWAPSDATLLLDLAAAATRELSMRRCSAELSATEGELRALREQHAVIERALADAEARVRRLESAQRAGGAGSPVPTPPAVP